ncbi:hypothetical protein CEP52_005247 [Fusarium oligoseptatum]|uniref:DUF4246 domain-containing protein n=1 Tax=Fusarium oligoseptatum TaxID=2604345 RepID=A0A428TZM4_9HYPO|nr:hypothetical protein CEP52_005247 [Fusarium oligoseptatum]
MRALNVSLIPTFDSAGNSTVKSDSYIEKPLHGRTNFIQEELVGVYDAVDHVGKGATIAKDEQPESDNVFWSTTYQWLPANISFRDDGTVRFTSYVNNLNPDKFPEIYDTLERLIGKAIPAWGQCLHEYTSWKKGPVAGRVDSRFHEITEASDSDDSLWAPELDVSTSSPFYSSSIFVQSGVSQQKALWASWGFGLVNFAFAIPASWLIDAHGRRTLLPSTFPHMAWTLLVAGCCFLINGDGTTRLILIALFIFSFTAFYSIGLGPMCYVYAADVFPLSHRELGMAWSVVVNAGGASALAPTFPYSLSVLSPTGAFGFYCGLNFLDLLIIFFSVPETKQLTLVHVSHATIPSRYSNS